MSKTFWVKSTVRSVHTRLIRAQAPERARFKQYILGGSLRLIRNRPISISADLLKAHSKELEQKWKSGLLEVRVGSVEGPVYDFQKKPAPPPPPQPEEPKEKKEKEPHPEPPSGEFVPVEEPVKRRGRKPKKD